MKKFVPASVALAAVILAGFAYLWHEEPYRARAMEIAPPESILFAQLPDLRRSAQRWPATALAQLWNEPEMQAFFAQPLEKMPLLLRAQEHWQRLRRIGLREAFLAVVAVDGPTPKFVAGLNFSGRKSEVAALVAEPWAAWRKRWPAGRAELLRRPDWEIETYASEEQLLAGSFHAGWYFVANDLTALEQTLARCGAEGGSGVGSTAALQRAAAPLPAELDVFVFAQPSRLLAHLGAVLASVAGIPAASDPPHPSEPMAWGVKFEGAQIRDTIFFAGARGADAPLERRTQALTSPGSLLYGAFVLPVRLDLPPAISPLLAIFEASPGLALASEVVSWPDFTAAFGPECGLVLDWPTAADTPSLSFVFAVRDPGRVASFVESLTGQAANGIPWQREEQNGVIHYQAPGDRKRGAAPALALAPEFAVLGTHAAAVRADMARLETGGANIGQSAAFQEAAARLSAPTTAFAYLDLRALFERSYETFRPFLGISLALSPGTGPYFDTAKLPSTAAIAQHLGPSAYSQSVAADGIFIEAIGSLSFSQALAGLATFAWTSATPAMRRRGKDASRPLLTTPALPRAQSSESPAKSGKPADNSRDSENDDEKSHVRASQP